MKFLASLALMTLLPLDAHEGSKKNSKPTAARQDLKDARKALDAAKKQLGAGGQYKCCVKPSCDLCAATKGSCDCAANVTAGKGSCGECLAGRKVGRATVKGPLELLPSEKQATAPAEMPPELQQFREKILNAKRTLVKEKRFQCCISGGCTQCAFEGECPCGADLAEGKKGVCGDCFDKWHSGHGSFDGIPLSDVHLAGPHDMMSMSMEGMGPGTGPSSGTYGSGTSQQPSATPHDMLMRKAGSWNLMVHGDFFGIYTNQTGPRGRDKIFGAGMIMPMASRRVGPGTLTIRAMLSPEPLLITHGRYPLLLQEGETWKNIPIINGQHPHDFFMELAALYQIKFGERTSLNFYGGPRGDPALGPVAYPHRVSQSENPIGTLGHHFQDSTHIATNVVTMGVTHGPMTLEASGFRGREPDERRWNLEKGKVDSYSGRLTLTPTSRWQAQYSLGRINSRETQHPERDTFRQTASVTYVRPWTEGHWASTVLWGRNHELAYLDHSALQPRQIFNSYLAESTVLLRNKHWIWGRAELTDKDSLLLYTESPFVRSIEEQPFTRVKAFTIGYARELKPINSFLKPAIGGQWMAYGIPSNLVSVFSAHPQGMQFFLRVRIASGKH